MCFVNNISIAIYNSFVLITHIVKVLHVQFLPNTIMFLKINLA